MRRISPFVWGHVLGAFLAGAISGAFLDMTAVMVFSASLAGAAIVSALVCWWWPKFDSASWKLWLVATFANPVLVTGLIWSVAERDCLLGTAAGWDCMFAEVGLASAAVSLPSPLIGLAARWLVRKAYRKERATT